MKMDVAKGRNSDTGRIYQAIVVSSSKGANDKEATGFFLRIAIEALIRAGLLSQEELLRRGETLVEKSGAIA